MLGLCNELFSGIVINPQALYKYLQGARKTPFIQQIPLKPGWMNLWFKTLSPHWSGCSRLDALTVSYFIPLYWLSDKYPSTFSEFRLFLLESVAATALLIYDTLLCLFDEFHLVWEPLYNGQDLNSRSKFSKLLYILSRYLMIATCIMSLLSKP